MKAWRPEFGTAALTILLTCLGILFISWYADLLGDFPNLRQSAGIFPMVTTPHIASNPVQEGTVDELILHYVRLYVNRTFEVPLEFLHCLGVYSAVINLQPSVIYLHTTSPTPFPFENCEKLLNVTIDWPPVKTFIVALQFTMNGQYIRQMSHEADIRKLKALEEYGGIVLDFDVYIINGSSLQNLLRSSECVVCYEDQFAPDMLVNGGLLGCWKAHARFPQLVLEESYRQNYDAEDWLYNIGYEPWQILQRHNGTATVLDGPCNHVARDWSRDYGSRNWTSLPAYHSYAHNDPATRKQVLKWDNALGEVARWLLLGSSNLSELIN